jgi:hypothetical protein
VKDEWGPWTGKVGFGRLRGKYRTLRQPRGWLRFFFEDFRDILLASGGYKV